MESKVLVARGLHDLLLCLGHRCALLNGDGGLPHVGRIPDLNPDARDLWRRYERDLPWGQGGEQAPFVECRDLPGAERKLLFQTQLRNPVADVRRVDGG